eukprot:RCo045424
MSAPIDRALVTWLRQIGALGPNGIEITSGGELLLSASGARDMEAGRTLYAVLLTYAPKLQVNLLSPDSCGADAQPGVLPTLAPEPVPRSQCAPPPSKSPISGSSPHGAMGSPTASSSAATSASKPKAGSKKAKQEAVERLSPQARLYNWTVLAGLLDKFGFTLEPDIKTLIVAGDVEILVDMVKSVHQHLVHREQAVQRSQAEAEESRRLQKQQAHALKALGKGPRKQKVSGRAPAVFPVKSYAELASRPPAEVETASPPPPPSQPEPLPSPPKDSAEASEQPQPVPQPQ